MEFSCSASVATSFKMFTVYREVNLYVNDATVYNVMERLRDLGGIAAVHTENWLAPLDHATR